MSMIDRAGGTALVIGLVSVACIAGCDSRPAPVRAGLAVSGREAMVRRDAIPPAIVLSGVAAGSPRDAWAVGYYGEGISAKTLALHWNGAAWTQMHTPAPGARSDLRGVAATSARKAWAVGTVTTRRGLDPLILRWNGTTWNRFPGPRPGPGGGLTGISAVSATDAWAVGVITAVRFPEALIVHWNGTRWSQVRSHVRGLCNLRSVAAVSARDAWTVGYSADVNHPLILHWNGVRWTRAITPAVPGGSLLSGVAATSPSNAWAIGTATAGTGKTLILHWNGSTWARSPSPNPTGSSALAAVAATSAKNAWAVGSTSKGKTLILRWNGTRWTQLPSPAPMPGSGLYGAAAPSGRDAWAVGGNLIVRWNGRSWLTSSGQPRPVRRIELNPAARRFIRMVPPGDTGYPGIGLAVASAPSVRPAAAKVASILNQFDATEVDHGLLGTRPRPPDVTFAIVTDYGPLSAGMRPRARFPAVVLTYRNVPCQSYGPPSDRGPRQFKCTAVTFYDLKHSRWLGIYEYTDASLSAIKKA